MRDGRTTILTGIEEHEGCGQACPHRWDEQDHAARLAHFVMSNLREAGYEVKRFAWNDAMSDSRRSGCVAPGCDYSAADGSSYCTLHVIKWGREADPLPPSKPEQEPHQYQWLGNAWRCLSCDVQIRNRDCPHNLAMSDSPTPTGPHASDDLEARDE